MATIREINLNIPVLATSNPVEEAALENVKELFDTDSFFKSEYLIPDTETENMAIDILISDRDDDTIILSTFGGGSLTTKGTVTIDDVENIPYRTEFYAIAGSPADSIIVGEVIAKLAFIVCKNEEALFPGMVLTGVSPTAHEHFTHILLAPAPVGIRENIKVAPVQAGTDFAIFWINVMPITEIEASLISEGPEGYKTFETFMISLGYEAYSLSRETYKPEAE
jgi:hypothetical protein